MLTQIDQTHFIHVFFESTQSILIPTIFTFTSTWKLVKIIVLIPRYIYLHLHVEGGKNNVFKSHNSYKINEGNIPLYSWYCEWFNPIWTLKKALPQKYLIYYYLPYLRRILLRVCYGIHRATLTPMIIVIWTLYGYYNICRLITDCLKGQLMWKKWNCHEKNAHARTIWIYIDLLMFIRLHNFLQALIYIQTDVNNW